MDNEAKGMIKGCVDTLTAKADELVSVIKNINFSILVLEEIKEYARIAKDTENLTEKEFEERFNAGYERSKKLGSCGWIPFEYCNEKEIDMWYQYLHDSPQKILEFFEENNCHRLNDIKNTLSKYYSERPFLLYYQNGIAAFERSEYMTAAIYLTILLENRIANLVEFPEKVNGRNPTYAYKYSDEGFKNQKSTAYVNTDDFTEKWFLFLNVYPAMIAYLKRLFAFGKLPLDLNKESPKEPDYLDRTWLMHGRCCRDTAREDCIQLLNALDVCEFALRYTKDTSGNTSNN